MEDKLNSEATSPNLNIQKIEIPKVEDDRKRDVRSLVDAVAQIAVDFVDQDGNKRKSMVNEMLKTKVFLKKEEETRLNSIAYAVSGGSKDNAVQNLQSVKNAEIKLNEMFKTGRKSEIKFMSGDPEGGEPKQNILSIENTFNPDNSSTQPDKITISIDESGNNIFWSSVALINKDGELTVDYDSPYTSFVLPSKDSEGREVVVPAIQKANEAASAFQIAATKLHQEITRATPRII